RKDVIVQYLGTDWSALAKAIVEQVPVQLVGRRISARRVVERHFHNLAAAGWRRLSATGRVHGFIVGGIDLDPQCVLAARHLVREQRGLHDVDDRSARGCDRLFSFDGKTYFAGDDDENSWRVGMQAGGET